MMTTLHTSKYILGVLAVSGMLAGCGGQSQSSLTPSAGMSAVHTFGALVTPDRHKRHEKFAYISNFYGSDVQEFHFPKGEPLSGTIHGLSDPEGMCTRTARGTFWIVESGAAAVDEYRAGGTTKLKSLTVTADAGEPVGCTIDRSSGDLAVSLIGAGDVVVFKGGTGSGTEVSDGLEDTFFVGYDGSGDLFVDGETSTGVGLVEMPAGSSTFHVVVLPNTIEFPGSVQWDGTYITLSDQLASAIYRYSVSNFMATLEGTVTFSGGAVNGDIYKGYYLGLGAGNEPAVYAYPAGGAPLYSWTSSKTAGLDAIVVEK